MNKEEDYRNLAGNITMFTDNTSFYEDWLVIQQYVDDWLDEIDNLQQENKQLKENNQNMQVEMCRTWKKHDQLKQALLEIKELINKCILEGWDYEEKDRILHEMLDIVNKALGDIKEYIEKEIKDMPNNGCSIRLKEVLDIANKELGSGSDEYYN